MGPVPSDLPKIEEALRDVLMIGKLFFLQYMILLIRIPCSHLTNKHYEVGKWKDRQCGRTCVS